MGIRSPWRGSFPTGDFVNNVDSDPGILINSQVFYTINRGWNMGVMASWERHKLDALGTDIGKLETISILPFIEFHYRAGRWSPYLSFGIGMNFNALKEDSNVTSFCNSFGVGSCDVDVDNTLALRVGGGTDFFLTDNLAINVEGAWKKNSGDFDVKVAGSNQGSGKFKGHVAQGMVGLKYYF